ncbi:MAG TPA: TauD/TfdA family dioxygenase [Pyrinomonadaceae bacterium]|jgi:alpha-ketoglutarate-dependent taurine dioxygenase
MGTSATITNDSPAQFATLTDCDPSRVRASLKEAGAVLIRAGASAEDFEALSARLMTPVVHHSTSTAVERDAISADATTATVNKGMDYIPLHREASYAPGCPDLLMLYCVRPADEGGETFVCDGVELVASLPASTRDFVKDAVLKWRWKSGPERWKATLGAASKEEAAARLKLLEKRLPEWEKLEAEFYGDTLEGVFQTLCVIPTRWGGLRSFCNSLLIYHHRDTSPFYPKTLYTPTLGDGSPFPSDVLQEVTELAAGRTHDLTWEAGDILLVDNSRFMHGRRAFTDTDRRILFRMGHVKGEG